MKKKQVTIKIQTNKEHTSPEPHDGTFIGDDDLHDGFSMRGTVRYGEETDVDDL